MGKGEKLTFGFLTDRMYFSLPVAMYSGIRKAAAENDIGIISFSGMPLNSTRDYCRQANILYELAKMK